MDFKIVYVYDNLHSFCQYLFLNLTSILLGKDCVGDINSFYHKRLKGGNLSSKMRYLDHVHWIK